MDSSARFKQALQAVFKRPLLIILAAVIVVAALYLTRPRLQPMDLAEKVWPVEVMAVVRTTEQPDLELFGEVVAGRRSEMRALVPGTIVAVGPGFRDGGAVSAGDLLVQIDPFEYESDVAEQTALLKEARANLEITRRNLGRIEELVKENNASEQALDDARLAEEQQVAGLEQARIGLSRAERALRDTRLTAPYNGVVSQVAAHMGKRLSVNDKVAEVIDTEQLEVRFTVSNAQFGRLIDENQDISDRSIRVEWRAGDKVLSYDAAIERSGAEIDSTSGGVELFALVESAARTVLRPGAFVWVRMPDMKYQDVIRAPESSLYGNDTVYVVQDDRLQARTVELVGRAGNEVLLRADETTPIQEGEQLVTTQIREGGEGISVEIR